MDITFPDFYGFSLKCMFRLNKSFSLFNFDLYLWFHKTNKLRTIDEQPPQALAAVFNHSLSIQKIWVRFAMKRKLNDVYNICI